jgi:hypothetical protein
MEIDLYASRPRDYSAVSFKLRPLYAQTKGFLYTLGRSRSVTNACMA